MPDPQKNIEVIWKTLSPKYDLPPLDEFKEKMKNPSNVEKIRQIMSEKYNLVDASGAPIDSATFAKKVGLEETNQESIPTAPKTFTAPLGTTIKSGFSVPSDRTFTSIPQGFMGAESSNPSENKPLEAAYSIARNAEMADLGQSNKDVASKVEKAIRRPWEYVRDKVDQMLGRTINNEDESKKTAFEFQNYVKYLKADQRDQIRSDIEKSNIKDTLKESFIHSLRMDVTPVVTLENVVSPQKTGIESIKQGANASTKDYQIGLKMMMDAKDHIINPENVDIFIDDMYNRFVGYGIPSKNDKEVAREALGIEQDLSGKIGEAIGRLPAFFGEIAVVNASTGGSGSIAQVFSGASKTMKVIGGLTEEAIKMGLQQSVFEGADFKQGAEMGASYFAGGQITGAIFGHTLASRLMVNGLSARAAGKTVAAIQSGTGAILGGMGLHLASGETVNSDNVAIDAMMGTVLGLFHASPELRKKAIDNILNKSADMGIVDPSDLAQMKAVLYKTTSDTQNFKEVINQTLKTIRESKGKDFASVIEKPIDIQSDFPLKNISEIENEPVKITEQAQKKSEEILTNKKESVDGKEKEAQKEKILGDVTDVNKSGQGTAGVSETAQTSIESKPSEVIRVKPSDIKIDENRFQNRTKLDEDVLKQITEKYSDQEMDPLKVWTDPTDGQTYLLAGHHRLEAAKRTGAETIKVEQFKGTEQEAIDYATTRSNANRSMESELDRAKIYRKMRESGSSNSEIAAKAEIEGKNKGRVIAFSYLNPEGKTADALKTIPSSSDQYNTVRQISQWVGETRKLFPELTNSHENEIFDYLVKGGQAIFGNKVNFIDRIDNIVNRIDFNKDKPLNIANRVSKSEIEVEFDKRLSEAQGEFDKASKDLNEFRKRAIDQGLTGDALEKALKPYNDAVIVTQRDLLNIKSQKGAVKDAAKTQTDIFAAELDNVEQQIKEGTIDGKQAETIVANLENKGKSKDFARAQSLIKAFEDKKRTNGSVSDAEAREILGEIDDLFRSDMGSEHADRLGKSLDPIEDRKLILEIARYADKFKDVDPLEKDASGVYPQYASKMAREAVETALGMKASDNSLIRSFDYKKSIEEQTKSILSEIDSGRMRGGGGEASKKMYTFSDIPVETNPTLQMEIHPIEIMEALEILRNNGLVPVVKEHLGNALGFFRPVGNGKIKLARSLFLPGNETELVKVMFHEIGHWVDWMPDKDLRRGGLGSRLQSMFNATNESLDFKNAEFSKELKLVSKEWRPWDEENAGPKEKKYRNSSREIYADFISALFNNPGYVKRVAPKSFDTFFKYLDRKPTIKSNYFAIQSLYNGGFESVVSHRDKSVGAMFDQHDYKAAELQSLREAEMERRRKSWVFSLSADIIDQNIPLQKKVEKAQRMDKAAGRTPNEELKDILPFNRDMNYIDRQQEAIVRKVELIHDEAIAKNIDWQDVGRIMLYERITKGDRFQMLNQEDYFALTGLMTDNEFTRVDLHNPRGLNRENAQELIDHIKTRLGDDQFKTLNGAVSKIRKLFKEEIDFAHETGLISDDRYVQFSNNPFYAPFQVTDYINESVSPHFYQQLGTFKDIRNPADAALLKMLVMRSAGIKNRARATDVGFMFQYFPEDVVDTKRNSKTGKFEPVDEQKAYGLKPIVFMVNGEAKSAYVESYIHDMMTLNKPLANNVIQKIMSGPNNLNKNLMLTFSAGWQLSNHFFMDPFRSWINTPSWSLSKFIKNRIKAYGPSLAYAFNLKKSKHYGESIRLLEEGVLGEGFKDLTYEALVQGETPADRHIHEVLFNSGIGSFKSNALKKNKWMEPVAAAMSFVNQFTAFMDNVAKTQAFYDLSSTPNMRPSEVRDFVHRNAGTPAFRETGRMANVINPVFLFASSNLAALSADAKLATSPKTRAGWWAKVATTIFAPHALVVAAQYGYQYLSDDQKKQMPWLKDVSDMYRDIPEYDKTNYITIPFGRTENNKVAYVRIPFDQTSRLMGAIFHKALASQHTNQNTGQMLADILSETYGGLPGLNPSLKTVADGAQFLSTGNAYNAYTGRMVLPDQVQKAGGWRARKMFLQYVFEQMGGSVFVKPYTNSKIPANMNPTAGERVLGLPILGPLASRFYRESNRGTSEYLRNITTGIDQQQAEQILATDDAITRFVQSGKMDGDELIKALKEENVNLRDRLEPQRIKLKLKAALIRGESDPFMNALIDAGIEKRIAIIQEAKKFMADDEYLKYLKQARAFGLLPK